MILLEVVLAPHGPGICTEICPGPIAASNGIIELICVGDTISSGTGVVPSSTCVPPSVAGSGRLDDAVTAPANCVPNNENMVPGASVPPATKLAALTAAAEFRVGTGTSMEVTEKVVLRLATVAPTSTVEDTAGSVSVVDA